MASSATVPAGAESMPATVLVLEQSAVEPAAHAEKQEHQGEHHHEGAGYHGAFLAGDPGVGRRDHAQYEGQGVEEEDADQRGCNQDPRGLAVAPAREVTRFWANAADPGHGLVCPWAGGAKRWRARTTAAR